MADVRFKIDHHQMGLVIKVIDSYVEDDTPGGELNSMLKSLVEQLAVRLRKRHAERRLEYNLILPVHQALALRRMVMVGMELIPEGQHRGALRMLLGEIDVKTVQYTKPLY